MGQTDEPAPHDVICKDGLVLVESSTSQIECIHETTAQKMGGRWYLWHNSAVAMYVFIYSMMMHILSFGMV